MLFSQSASLKRFEDIMEKRKKEQNTKKKKHSFWKVFLALLLIIGALLAESYYRICVSEYELSYENLPESFDGFRIVQLSDLHLKQFGENNSRLLAAVEREEPDIIVLTGDFINRVLTVNGEQGEQLKPFFEQLSQIAPCYYVSGNHEWASGELETLADILQDCGIEYFRNEYTVIEREGGRIVLAGVEDPNGHADMIKPPELVAQLRQQYPDDFVVFLGHRNDWLEKYPQLDVDIIFCGHAHGGIVRLPFIGGIFGTDHNLFPKYTAGVYDEGNYKMVLSRGLGGMALPRFLNPGELVTVILKTK